MPTLLQINVCCATKSTGKICEDIALVAMKNGYECYMAYGRTYKPSKCHEIKIGNKLNVYEHYAEHRMFDNDGLASRFVTKKFLKQVDIIKPDIIHLHNIHDHYINYKMLFEYIIEHNIPVVWTQHDCWAFSGGCMYFDETGCEKWKSGCGSCPIKGMVDRSSHHYNLKKSLTSHISNLIMVPVSDWIAGLLRQSFMKDRAIITLKNGIDLNVFKPSQSNLRTELNIHADKTIVLGVACPWSKRKGMDDFIKLAEDKSLQIVLVGMTAKQKSALPSSIIAIERTHNQQELAQYYTMADVFVNATYSDNYPTTNLEAMACGTPVITYNTGGSIEAVTPETGMIVEQGNIESLREAIHIMVSKDSEKRNKMSADCVLRAKEFFDKDKCFEKYIELYNKILKVNE